MKVGLQIPSFTWPGGPEAIAPTFARIVRDADAAGFDSIWVMDHFFQIRSVGRVDEPMLEGMTALGFPFPPLGQRFEMLEETLQIAHAMFEGERGTEGEFHGRQFHATRLLNSPQSLSRPRVPIMIGGGGERKTLRLVAQYADACNVFGQPSGIARKYAILREHCQAVGRPYQEIERSTLQFLNISSDGRNGTETPSRIVDRLGELGDAGAQHIVVSLRDVFETDKLELIGRELIPQLKAA
jgi:alkanesulfonate monooxygenase SsuD/methylene tetrahydromethanopterin reductase-like flavin-dependent oxidoreductase (luciferase family)